MANLFNLRYVEYVCCCGSLNPICFVYFCKHCLRLRCRYCVYPEVDSHFCGNCSENMPAAEAKLKKNKCNSCYDCPCCQQTLSIRATTTQTPSDEDPTKLVTTKLHYLLCGFCRWSSRDAGIPDKPFANGPWLEPEGTEGNPLDAIADYFRQLGVYEKATKEHKHVPKAKFLAAGRHGLAHLLPNRFPSAAPEEKPKGVPKPTYLAPALDERDLPEVNEHFYAEEHTIPNITTLSQRLTQVEHQPRHVSGLLPLKKHLLIKRSLHCRVCERSIMKPEYSPVSIKFKLQSNAYYLVPQIRLLAPFTAPLLPGQRTQITIRISNPMAFPTTVKFLPFAFVPLRKGHMNPDEVASLGTEGSDAESSLTPFTMAPATRLYREVTVLPIFNSSFTFNCHLQPPDEVVILPPKTEGSELDTVVPDFNDDPSFVPWRNTNKANVILEIERLDKSKEDELLTLGFTMEYDFTNYEYMADMKGEGPQKLKIQTHVLINLTRLPDNRSQFDNLN